MRIATWNVNSVRARLPRVLAWLEQRSPDVVCMQEIKCQDHEFPREPIEELGYRVETFGQKTYNGVAILSKRSIDDVVRGFQDGAARAQLEVDDALRSADDVQRRLIGATIDDVLLLNLYVVNGQSVGHEKYDFKLQWLERLRRFVAERYDMREKVVLCGDFNVTFDDRDVHDPDAWREQILCSTPEREALARVMDVGLTDALRRFREEAGIYTWWDFRTRAFQRGEGLRIDHFLVSAPALEACTGVEVDVEERGRERPSDHAPVIATFR